MKPAVAFIAAFVLATAAATGASAKLHPAPKPPAPPADSSVAAADSTQSDSASTDSSATDMDTTLAARIADTAHVMSVAPTAAASPSVPGTQTSGAQQGGAKGAAIVAPAISVPGLPAVGSPRATPANNAVKADTASQRHLAKLFASMQPKEAAQVLQRMADSDVQVILGYVGTRQAAAILAALPPDRVAAMSKIAMRGGNGGRDQ